jgi:hypothetical protein
VSRHRPPRSDPPQERGGQQEDGPTGRKRKTGHDVSQRFLTLLRGTQVQDDGEEHCRDAGSALKTAGPAPRLGSAEKAGSVFASLEKKGFAIESCDAMIAGVALDNNLTVVTRNIRDYSKVPGLTLEEW